MIKEVIKEAKTQEEAIEIACRELGKNRDEVQVEILERAKKGFFGIGSSDAKVRVFYEDEATEETKIQVEPKQEKSSETGNKAKKALEFLKNILDDMDITDYTSKIEEDESGISIVLEGEKLGAIIGRRGETLDAIQYLVSLAANRVDNKYTRITIDTGNYREKREKTLQSLARKIAINAVKTGRSTTLEPMNPYERRIIHAAVSQIEGATSTSVGEEPNRKVIISSLNPVKKSYNKDRKQGGYNKGGKRHYNNNKGDRRYGRQNEENIDLKSAEKVQAPVINKEFEEKSDAQLYSKIEF